MKTDVLEKSDLLNQSPRDVLKQVKILTSIYGSFEAALDSVEGMKAYRHKLNRTYEHYKKTGYYEKQPN